MFACLHREIQNCLTFPQKRSLEIFYLFNIVVRRRRRTRITNSSEKVKVSIANCRCQSILQCYSTTSLLFCGQSKLKGVCHSFELLHQNFSLRNCRFTKLYITITTDNAIRYNLSDYTWTIKNNYRLILSFVLHITYELA